MSADSSDDSSFVPAAESHESDEVIKRRKTDQIAAQDAQLADEELDALWAEMNGGRAEVAQAPAKEPLASNVDEGGEKKSASDALDIAQLLAQVKGGAGSGPDAVEKETVIFAGQKVEVEVARPGTKKGRGSDNISDIIADLKSESKTRRINSVEKSQLDWDSHKAHDRSVQDELQRHMKSGTYLEKTAFLKRAEAREYELERQAKGGGRRK